MANDEFFSILIIYLITRAIQMRPAYWPSNNHESSVDIDVFTIDPLGSGLG